jgi:hypothetical protein
MSDINISIDGGTSKRLLTAGKYCDRNIVITSTGGTEDLDDVLIEQEILIDNLQKILKEKAIGSAGEDVELLVKALVEGNVQNVSNALATKIAPYGFYQNSALISLTTPNVKTLGRNTFTQCSNLPRVEFPMLTSVGGDCFSYCYALTYADLGLVASIPSWCFASCSKLAIVILRKTDKIATLSTVNGFSGTGVEKGTGYIYVPAALVDSYKSATNWSTYAAQIRAIEDYPDICG